MGSRSFASTLTSSDVARGVCRLFASMDYGCLTEFSLANNRRADVAALGAKGDIVLTEIKISVADYLGDKKWPEYFDYADRLYFAVPHGFPLDLFERAESLPARVGLIVTDGRDATILRPATLEPLAAARRKAVTLAFARRAADRLLRELDPNAWSGVRMLG
jgi:hypothetical protein